MATSTSIMNIYLIAIIVAVATNSAYLHASASALRGVQPDHHRLQSSHVNSSGSGQCSPGQCYVAYYAGCFHLTSRECNTDFPALPPPTTAAPTRRPAPTPPPTTRPTPRPVVERTEVVHPVKLTLKDVPTGYKLTAYERSMLLRYVMEILDRALNQENKGLELVKVEYAGRLASNRSDKNVFGRRRTAVERFAQNGGGGSRRRAQNAGERRDLQNYSVVVPLAVTVVGPTNIADFSLSYIIDALRDNFDELKTRLEEYGETLDVNVFQNVVFGIDTFDFQDIDNSPTNPPSVPSDDGKDESAGTANVKNEENVVLSIVGDTNTERVNVKNVDGESSFAPWWVWLLVAMVIILLCICCVCGYLRRTKDDEKSRREKEINIWMQREISTQADVEKQRHLHQQQLRRQSRRSSALAVSRGGGEHHEKKRQSKRYPSHAVAPKPSIRRSISQTEREELEHDRSNEEAPPVMDVPSVVTKQPPSMSNISVITSADPPEEKCHNHIHENHDAGNPGPYALVVKEEPEGTKIHKRPSVFAEEIYLKKAHSSKEIIYTCSMKDLPDDARDKVNSQNKRRSVKERQPINVEEEEPRSSRAAAEHDGNRKKTERRKSRKKRRTIERLRSSFTHK